MSEAKRSSEVGASRREAMDVRFEEWWATLTGSTGMFAGGEARIIEALKPVFEDAFLSGAYGSGVEILGMIEKEKARWRS